jgi:hypothetical protein
MTFEQWVEATKKGAALGDDATDNATDNAADNAAPSIDTIAYDAFSGGVEEEETQKPDTTEEPVQPSSHVPRGLLRKPLAQRSLSK